MNIVIVNHYAGGPDFGMEFRPYYLAKEWTKKGNNVMIIGASFSHLRTVQPCLTLTYKRETIENINYLWLKTNSYKGNGLGRVLSMFLFCIRLRFNLKTILAGFRPDLIIASSTYPLDTVLVRHLAVKYGALSCYEVHDLWPLSPMELGGYSKYHPFMMLLQAAENFAYKHLDFVVSMLPNTLEHMIAHGMPKEKFYYIPNGIAVDEWSQVEEPKSHILFLCKLKEEGHIIVGYVGGHAISNALDTLIEAALIAKKESPQTAFVLVGNGTEKKRLKNLVANLNLSNVFFLEPVPKRCIPRLLNEMDILYLGWHDNPLYRFGISPNKLMDYMMAGKPIIHSVNTPNDLVSESSCGISVSPGDAQGVVNALVELERLDQSERVAMGLSGKNFVIKNYDYSVLAEKFLTFANSQKK